MTAVYVIEQGSVVSKNCDRIIVTLKNNEIFSIAINEVDSLIAYGGVQISSQALLFLLDQGVHTSFMTERGEFRGTCIPAYAKNNLLRIAVYRQAEDADYCLRFSKQIVKAKYLNGLELLKKYHYSQNSDYRIDDLSCLSREVDRVDEVLDQESLLGVEGNLARLYFGEYAKCFRERCFPGRQYFPAKDPINACLSFAYSNLSREIQSLLNAHGIDPYIGLYHKLSYGRASLSLDLVEEFRHIVCDRLILNIFNRSMLDDDDFQYSDDGACYLKKENLRRFISIYEEYLWDESYPFMGNRKSVKHILKKQVEQFKHAITNGKDYSPYFTKDHL